MIDELLKLSTLGIYIHAASVSITLGFPIAIMVSLWKYYKTGHTNYFTIAKTLTAVLAVNFALGGVTGTLVEFGLVQIWPGTIFAIESFAFSPLALELIAFINEIAFLVLFIVTLGKWKTKRSIVILTIYWFFALLSGALITSVNSWMQSPQGTGPIASAIYPFLPSYGPLVTDVQKLVTLKLTLVSSRQPLSILLQDPNFAKNIGIVLNDPFIAFNGVYFIASILHNLTAAIIVGLSLVAAGYSYRYLKTKNQIYVEFLKPIFLLLFVLMLVQPTIFGHLMGEAVVQNQPTKIALMEGAKKTFTNPFLGLIIYGDPNHPIIGFDNLIAKCISEGNLTLGELANVVGINTSSLSKLNISSDTLNIKISDICINDLNSAIQNMNLIHITYYMKIILGILALLASATLALSFYRLKAVSKLANILSHNGSHRAVFLYSLTLFLSASGSAILGWFVRESGRKPWSVYGLLYPQEIVNPVELSSSPTFLAFATFVILAVTIFGYLAMYVVATRPELVNKLMKFEGGSK